MAKTVGVDLGTANTLMCIKGAGIVVKTPSAVAINRDTREIIAQGAEAKRMMGKAPMGINVFRPIKDGVITDADVTSRMLRTYFKAIGALSTFSRPVVVASIPYGVTEVERSALESAIFYAGARRVALIDEPIAAALGSGLQIGGPRGNMIVDIGGGTTEVAVISMGGIVASRSVRVAGDEIDEAIVDYIRRERGILIGSATAEELKKRIGSAHPDIDRGLLTVSGMTLPVRRGKLITVSTAEVREAMEGPINNIIATVKQALEQTPPELSSDLYDFGITLTGGGALIPGIDRRIAEKTGVRVRIAQRPMESVCRGILRVIDTASELEGFLRYRER
jgi:rod shape-determining protein MreB